MRILNWTVVVLTASVCFYLALWARLESKRCRCDQTSLTKPANLNCAFICHRVPEERRQAARQVFASCMKVLGLLCQEYSIEHFLFNNSLLAFYRHNKRPMPWEDVVTMALVPTTNLKARQFGSFLQAMLRKGNPEYSVVFTSSKKQFSITCSGKTFVQLTVLNFSRGPDRAIIDPNRPNLQYPLDMIYPLKKAVFDGSPVYIPKDTAGMVELDSNPYVCSTQTFKFDSSNHSAIRFRQSCFRLVEAGAIKSLSNLVPAEEAVKNRLKSCQLNISPAKKQFHSNLCPFADAFTSQQREEFKKMLAICFEMLSLLEDAKFFIYAGSLLGYWRHNKSRIPWDDDADIALLPTRKWRTSLFYWHQLRKLVARYPEYNFHFDGNQNKFKLFGILANNSKMVRHGEFKWRWPFIDIQVIDVRWADNNNDNVTMETISSLDFNLTVDDVLPLQRDTFEGIPTWVPLNIPKVLSKIDIKTCKSPPYSHLFELPIPLSLRISRPCYGLGKRLAGNVGYQFTNVERTALTFSHVFLACVIAFSAMVGLTAYIICLLYCTVGLHNKAVKKP